MGWILPLLVLSTVVTFSGVTARPLPATKYTNYGQYRGNNYKYRQNASPYSGARAPAYTDYRNKNTYRNEDTYPSRSRDKGRTYDRDYGEYDRSNRYREDNRDHYRNDDYSEDYHHSTPAPEPTIKNITADIITANELRIGQWILHDELYNGQHYFVIRDSKTNGDHRFAIQEGLGNQWTFGKDRSLSLNSLVIGKWVIHEEVPEEDREFLVFRDTTDPDVDNRFAIEKNSGNLPTFGQNGVLSVSAVFFKQRDAPTDSETNNWVIRPESEWAFVVRDLNSPGNDYRYAFGEKKYTDL